MTRDPILKTMCLSHYQMEGKKLGELHSAKQLSNDDPSARIGKPQGLFVSVDGKDDWLSWCRSEAFGTSCPWFHHRIVLVEKANLLILKGAAELDNFTNTWADRKSSLYRSMGRSGSVWAIDWQALAGEYQGIIIAPYCWPRRLELSWYYGWDCASGVIWDVSAIARVEPVGLIEHPQKEDEAA